MVANKKLDIVITGGAGFIGSHLCDRLVQKGHRIVCIDNLDTGRIDNVRPLANHRNFTFVEGDVREPLSIDGPVDRIYNLACPASPPHYQRDPIGTIRTCVLGAQHVLELARATGARVLQASTSEVYGDPEMHPQAESYRGAVNPIGPRACYDEGKRCAEAMFFDYHRVHGVAIKVARIFNTYGPRMLENDGRVISNFVVQALRDQPITLYGDGTQTRSFCYVADLLDGLELLMESDPAVTGPVNLGNPREISVKEIAAMVVAQTRSRSTLAFAPLPQDDPRRRRPDVATAARLLGWQPRITLEDGLRPTIDYFALAVARSSHGTPRVDDSAPQRHETSAPRARRAPLTVVRGSA
ncbi:dTDP-glucose 4,6-dehydratase [Rhodovulum sp. PH10]|uniref:UDP-glucuronic acid decarboxylase family protein n=1 Tax=Rhodovulum sp. PH10 TaxID=1187851 RepID=UPI00027C208B|nr:UDP-glucuronic acid decarboxylase family protein [Rhodovulum sp. PH10]EJW10376.1 dTDP-glucose 4,6-dehydratase [Rhodovulum sp. PH10]